MRILKLFYILTALLFIAIVSFVIYLNCFFEEVRYEAPLKVELKSIFISRGAGYLNGEFVVSDGGGLSKDSFLSYVSEGDSIIKKSYSDTVQVKRESSSRYFILDSMAGHPSPLKNLDN